MSSCGRTYTTDTSTEMIIVQQWIEIHEEQNVVVKRMPRRNLTEYSELVARGGIPESDCNVPRWQSGASQLWCSGSCVLTTVHSAYFCKISAYCNTYSRSWTNIYYSKILNILSSYKPISWINNMNSIQWDIWRLCWSIHGSSCVRSIKTRADGPMTGPQKRFWMYGDDNDDDDGPSMRSLKEAAFLIPENWHPIFVAFMCSFSGHMKQGDVGSPESKSSSSASHGGRFVWRSMEFAEMFWKFGDPQDALTEIGVLSYLRPHLDQSWLVLLHWKYVRLSSIPR